MTRKRHFIALATFTGVVLGAGVGGAITIDKNTPDPTTSIEVISSDTTPALPTPAPALEVPETSTTTEPAPAPTTTAPTPVPDFPRFTPPAPNVAPDPVIHEEPAIEPAPTPDPLPACPEVTYDGINPPVWSTADGLPPTYDCNGPGYTELPS